MIRFNTCEKEGKCIRQLLRLLSLVFVLAFLSNNLIVDYVFNTTAEFIEQMEKGGEESEKEKEENKEEKEINKNINPHFKSALLIGAGSCFAQEGNNKWENRPSEISTPPPKQA